MSNNRPRLQSTHHKSEDFESKASFESFIHFIFPSLPLLERRIFLLFMPTAQFNITILGFFHPFRRQQFVTDILTSQRCAQESSKLPNPASSPSFREPGHPLGLSFVAETNEIKLPKELPTKTTSLPISWPKYLSFLALSHLTRSNNSFGGKGHM